MPKISAALRAERQEAILSAAIDCLEIFGYAGTTMQSIAQAARLTKGGLYAYFDSKEAILLEVAQRHMAEQLGTFEPLPGEDAPAQLHRILAAYDLTGQTEANARRQRAILDLWNNAASNPAVRSALTERYQRYQRALAGVIERGQAEGSFRPEANPGEVAGLILAARDGLIIQAVKWGLPAPLGALAALPQIISHWLAKGEPR